MTFVIILASFFCCRTKSDVKMKYIVTARKEKKTIMDIFLFEEIISIFRLVLQTHKLFTLIISLILFLNFVTNENA
jgi:hypothetical protein